MTNSDSRVAVYTGSFDPITLGHLNVIERASRLVDRLIVGIGVNIEKQSMFSPDERVELVRQSTRPSVERRGAIVRRAGGQLCSPQCGERGVMLRGVRSTLGDIETRIHDGLLANRKLDAETSKPST